ncbi:retrovirus-related pol polyprotein from transposon TNT 1-94 [Tanacetum coccineum]
MIKLFINYSTLEKHCISLEVDTQLNQEIFQRENSVSNQSAPSFDQLFKLDELKAQSEEKDTVIKKLKEIFKSLRGNMNKDKVKKDIEEIETINIELDHRVSKLIAENEHLKQTLHSKLNANSELVCVKCNGCMLFDNYDLYVLDFINDVNARNKSKSTFTIVGNACPLTKITTTAEVPLRKLTALESDTPKLVFVQIILWYLDSGCSKYMIEDRSQLTNFVNKFLGKAKFENEHVAKILGYGDYQIRNVTISRVYYVEGLRHNLFSIGKFCDSNLEVPFRQHTYFIHNLEGVDLLTGSQGNNLYTLSLRDMMASSPICLLHGLVQGLAKIKFEKDHLYSASEMGKSKKKPHKPKSEDTNLEKLYLLHMDLCGPMRVASVNGKKYILVIIDDYSRFIWVKCLMSKDEAPDFIIKRIIKTLHVDFDELTAMDSKHSSLRPGLPKMTPARISLGLVPNPPPSTPFVPPSKSDWDLLLQPLFDELLTPLPSVDHPAPKVIALITNVVAPEPAALTGSSSSTTVNQDAPSPKVPFDQSSSTDIIHTIVHPDQQISEHNTLFYYYDTFLTTVEPKTYKDSLTQSCWIEAMQEELNVFERLRVWELIPRPDRVVVITLKWIYKVKLDELGGILKNKALLVAHGYR